MLLVILYTLAATYLAIYGLHVLLLVVQYGRHRHDRPRTVELREFPTVTVQLPLYNEPNVVERIIEAAANLDWPRDRLQLQVLDDSTDRTTALARSAAEAHRSRGLNIEVIHRTNRSGFKAGALANGLTTAKGEFVAIFDADFVPAPDFLQKMMPHFISNSIGFVQARWDHLPTVVAVCQRLGDRRGRAFHRRADGAQSIGPADDLQRLGGHLAHSLHRGERRLGGRHAVRRHGPESARGDGRLAVRVRAGRGRAARGTGTHSAHQEPAWPLGQRRRAVPAQTIAATAALEVIGRAEGGRPDVSQRLCRAPDDVGRHRAVAAAGAATRRCSSRCHWPFWALADWACPSSMSLRNSRCTAKAVFASCCICPY